MPKRTMTIEHSLEKKEALKRLKKAAEEAESSHQNEIAKFGLKHHIAWNDNGGTFRASAMGFSAKGTLTVTDTQVTIEMNLPFLATMLFLNEIETGENQTREELEKILSDKN